MKLSRRKLAGRLARTAGAVSLTRSALAAAALAQNPVPAQPTDLDQAARDNNKRISDALSRYELPITTEPAFQFKA